MRPFPRSRVLRALALGALAAVTLSACQMPAAYGPRLRGQETGYTDRQLSPGRFRVTFRGNSATPREMVEDYLLLRAAEVSLAAGSDFFLFDTRDTRAQTRTTATTVGADPYWGWAPYGYWGFRPRWGYDPFGPDVMITQSTRYEAYAEIVLLTPEQARNEPRAVNARQVVANLGPAAADADPAPPPPPR